MKGYKLPIIKMPRHRITRLLPHFRHRAAICVIVIHTLACIALNYFVIATLNKSIHTQERVQLENITDFFQHNPLIDRYGLISDGHSLWEAAARIFPSLERVQFLDELGISLGCFKRDSATKHFESATDCDNSPPPSLTSHTRLWENTSKKNILWQSINTSNSAPYWLKLEIQTTTPTPPNDFLSLLLITEFIIGALLVTLVYYVAQHLEKNVDVLTQRIQLFEYSQFRDTPRIPSHELPWVLSDIEHTLCAVLDRVKQEVARLQQKEQLLETNLKHLSGISIISQADEKIVYASRPLNTLFKTSSTQHTNQHTETSINTLALWLHIQDIDTYKQALQKVTQDQGAMSCEVHLVHDNQKIPARLELTALPIDTKENFDTSPLILIYISDRSKEYNEKKAILDYSEKLMHWLDYLPLPIYIKDINGHYVFFNQAWENLKKLSKKDGIGKTAWDLFDNHYAQNLWDREKDTIEKKQITVEETFVHVGTELSRRALVYRTPTIDSQNKTYLIGTIVSLDGHIHHNDLETRLLEIEKQDTQHTQMLAHLSQEVRNYLHNLMGLIELMNAWLKTLALPHTNEYISLIQTLSHEILTSTTDINDILCFEQGTLAPYIHSFDIELILIECARHFCPQAESKHIEIIVNIDSAIPTVEGDPHLLRRALDTLVHNAVKYTPSGFIQINARLLQLEGEMASLCFEVTDTGVGIPKEQHTHIFEPFAQGDASLGQHAHTGSGLGLAVFSRLMKYAGCHYEIESEPRKGTKIRFYWSFLNVSTPISHTHLTLQNKNLLIVENHIPTSQTIREIVHSWGMHTIIAHSVEETMLALNQHEEKHIDAILIDGRLSEEDRSSPYRILDAAYKKNIAQRLVMLPVNAPFREHERYRQSHANTVLLKPIYRIELMKALLAQSVDKSSSFHRPQYPFIPTVENHGLKVARTLLATHDPINRKLLQGWLEQLGHRCIAVGTTEELLSYYTSEKFDLLFIDLDMARPSGSELIQLVSLQNKTLALDTPIIGMLSAKITDYFIPENAAVYAYIQKPVQQQALSTILNALSFSTPTISSSV